MLGRSPNTPLSTADRLQWVLNATARVVSGTRKFDRGPTQLRYSELHWLHIPECIKYKLGVTIHMCLQSRTPKYLVDCCTPTLNVTSHQRLCSASRYQLIVSRHRHSKFGCRAFSAVSPMTWNSLPDNLHDPVLSNDKFTAVLKIHVFSNYQNT